MRCAHFIIGVAGVTARNELRDVFSGGIAEQRI